MSDMQPLCYSKNYILNPSFLCMSCGYPDDSFNYYDGVCRCDHDRVEYSKAILTIVMTSNPGLNLDLTKFKFFVWKFDNMPRTYVDQMTSDIINSNHFDYPTGPDISFVLEDGILDHDYYGICRSISHDFVSIPWSFSGKTKKSDYITRVRHRVENALKKPIDLVSENPHVSLRMKKN